MSEETTPTVKSWYKSKTVVAGLLTALIGTLVSTGVLTPEAATPENIEAISTTWIDVATSVGIIVTGLLAVYGRVKAQTSIGK